MSSLEVDGKSNQVMVKVSRNNSNWLRSSQIPRLIFFVVMIYGLMSFSGMGRYVSRSMSSKSVKALTWNMAAINNNPFEYWITNTDPKYNKLMAGVSEFIKEPNEKDVTVGEIFTDDMFAELETLMRAAGWQYVDETKVKWNSEFKNRRIISQFIKDDVIGKKRLVSMPDRVTNTLSDVTGADVLRPTVINCYSNDLSDKAVWWGYWKKYMFTEPVKLSADKPPAVISSMLQKIKKSKYPAIESDEEMISIPLQTLNLAIFDAILVHMLNTVSADWNGIRDTICTKLNRKKTDRTIEILTTTYDDYDIQFLQEVGSSFINKASQSTKVLSYYDVHVPAKLDTKRDQNSIILLRKYKYKGITEVTDKVIALYNSKNPDSKLPVMDGDLFAVTVEKKDEVETQLRNYGKYLLASFHGDTNGLATKAVVTAVQEYASQQLPDHKLLFGMDANTYATPDKDQQGVTDFAQWYSARHLNTCYGPTPNPKNFTTFHARTYLQPQLNKAITYEEKDIKGDKNPKDFILFFKSDFDVIETRKDNTGKRSYIDGMVFPTLDFPSDHGITSTLLEEKSR
mmetsp:Transcript_18020/g.33850  ORF Transcript_18020/g.33850 Transcript_18020/m.33850 type:complete len:569 (+) Transcript_18020:90-1796(+)